MYYVYRALCFETGKSYIGCTHNIDRRWTEHRFRAENNGKGPFYDAIREFGYINFMTEILFKTDDKNIGFEKEREYIAKFNTRSPNGYNITEGGLGHTGCISPGMTGKKHSEQTKIKMSNSNDQWGIKNHMFGKHLTEERKNQISEFMKGNKYGLGIKPSKETIEKIRIASTGRLHPEESKIKMSIARKNYWDRKRGVS